MECVDVYCGDMYWVLEIISSFVLFHLESSVFIGLMEASVETVAQRKGSGCEAQAGT